MKIAALIGALALLASQPVETAKPTVSPPAAPVSRAKFPNEDPRAIDGLAFVNFVVNHTIQGMSDEEHYGVPDKAVSWPDDLKGDCEDYALSKQATLGRAGIPIVVVTRIRQVMVHRGKDAYGHAILEMLPPKGGIVFLDNLNDDLMTRPELEARGYEFYDW